MPHHAKPFFRTGRGYYVQLGKQQVKLADGPKCPANEALAWEEYHQVMSKRGRQSAPIASPQGDGLTIAEVFDKFLGFMKKRVVDGSNASRTYDFYHDHLQAFMDHAGAAVLAQHWSTLKPFHVIEWVDSHGDDWSPAFRRGAIVAIQRPFNWAEEVGYIPASPIKRIKKPQAQRRETFIAADVWIKIRDHYQEGDPFRELLEFSWESGCRPQESKKIESQHVDLKHHRVLFPPNEAKGKKRWRIIRLTQRAEAIVKKLAAAHPDGPIFRNEDGNPWTSYAISCRFGRLQKHLGVRYAAYDFRHGFCQDLLQSGGDPLAVAELMGHADGSMVSRIYSHMNQADAHLQRVLRSRNDRNGKLRKAWKDERA